jgi:hypothetical protein
VAGFTRVGRQLVAATSNSWCVWTPENGARMDFPTPTSPTVITSGRPSGKPYDLKPDEPLSALCRTDGAIEICISGRAKARRVARAQRRHRRGQLSPTVSCSPPASKAKWWEFAKTSRTI